MDFQSANPTIVKSIKQRDLLNTWLRLYAREQRVPPMGNTSPTGSATNFRTSSTIAWIPRNSLHA